MLDEGLLKKTCKFFKRSKRPNWDSIDSDSVNSNWNTIKSDYRAKVQVFMKVKSNQSIQVRMSNRVK